MTEMLAGWLVQQPVHIAVVAAIHAVLWAASGVTRLRDVARSNLLWAPALAWFAYAGWESWVLARTPEADIRVDLLLVWPVVGLVTLWAWGRTLAGAIRALRSRSG